MFTYTDETGHSGKNIFDTNQTFRLGSILSVNDISAASEAVITPFNLARGADRLHANQWQEHELADLGHNLLDALDQDNTWLFNVMQIHKPFIAPTKLVDLIFDPGENTVVPGGWYWDEMHRHKLCLQMDEAMSLETSKKFWDAYLKDDFDQIIDVLETVETFISSSTHPTPFKIVVRDAFKFARKKPKEFTMNATAKKKGYQAHSPNVIAFTQLFQAIHQFASDNGCKPELLLHDKQDEFRKELLNTYEIFGNVILNETGDGKFLDAEIAEYGLANLKIVPSVANFGLQAADLLLWVSQRSSENPNFSALKERMSERETPYYVSRGMSELIVNMHMKNRLADNRG